MHVLRSVFLLALPLAAVSAASAALPERLASDALCARCLGYRLPGALEQSPRADYRIDSDLPEIYYTNGVLYTTAPVLPPMLTKDGQPIPEEMRRQRGNLAAIDGSFEVFLYHLSERHAPGETRRIVIYAENTGTEPAVLTPRQAMFHGPNAGQPGSVESRLGEVVMKERWEDPVVTSVTVAPGTGEVIGWTKQIGAKTDSADASRSVFVTGTLRSDVESTSASLRISVVSIPGTTPKEKFAEVTKGLLGQGAQSGEGAMDLLIPPPECHVRRVVGTARNLLWRSETVTLDVAALPDGGVPFLMALPQVQAEGCETARQTADLLMYPGYVHPDSVGNFQMEYLVNLVLTNGGTEPRKAELRFGKTDARIGLGWQVAYGKEPVPLETLETLPVSIGWAGKGTKGLTEPFFDSPMLPQAIELAPGASQTVSLRLMVLGTSSLPYHLIVR